MHLSWVRNLPLVKHLRGRPRSRTGDHAKQSPPTTSASAGSLEAQDDLPGYEESELIESVNVALQSQGLTYQFLLQSLQQQSQYFIQDMQQHNQSLLQLLPQQPDGVELLEEHFRFELQLHEEQFELRMQLIQQKHQSERRSCEQLRQHCLEMERQQHQFSLQ
ncbi:hypothetical protein PG985_014076 [Apiospora marii]|uniref:uncharacterized protein n=1 Tax=Apiospora marii TaxID=335849 RepID=UPI00312E098D